MKFGIVILFLTTASCFAQQRPTQPAATGNATASGLCGTAITGNHNTVNYYGDCVSPEEAKENQTLNSIAYEAVGNALNTEALMREEWAKILWGCQRQITPMMMRNPSSIEAQAAEETLHFCILDEIKTFDPKWKKAEEQIQTQIDTARDRVKKNEMRKLQTNNQRNAWREEFSRTWFEPCRFAMMKAEHNPTVVDLIHKDTNADRFALLEKYLTDLRSKVGDYPSQ
jgi:hypothetical protein